MPGSRISIRCGNVCYFSIFVLHFIVIEIFTCPNIHPAVNLTGICRNNLTSNLAAVDVASTVAKVDQTLANVQQLTSKLNDNKGTLGLLMNDETLYYNLTNTVLSADSLLNNLREHPKRYVHFSLFGKKDK